MKKYILGIIVVVLTLGTIYSCTETNDEAAYEINTDSPDPEEHQRPGGGNG